MVLNDPEEPDVECFAYSCISVAMVLCGLIASMSLKRILSRWLPALVMMCLIFVFSAQPLSNLPNFDWADRIVKKGGHMIGYGLLALSYWNVLQWKRSNRWTAWLFAVLFALTDEYHQSFVVGRHSSIWDVMIFDNLGALIALWLARRYIIQKRPDESHA